MQIKKMTLVLKSLKEKNKTFKVVDDFGNLLFFGTLKECEKYFLKNS